MDKLVFDTKEQMMDFLKNPPRKLTKKELMEIYNNGKSFFQDKDGKFHLNENDLKEMLPPEYESSSLKSYKKQGKYYNKEIRTIK